MDRSESKSPPAPADKRYAEAAEVAPADAPLLQSPAGRADDHAVVGRGTLYADEVAGQDPGGVPRSAVTGDPEPGTDAGRRDGLNDLEEELRRRAEDAAVGEGEADLPLFERPLTPAKT